MLVPYDWRHGWTHLWGWGEENLKGVMQLTDYTWNIQDIFTLFLEGREKKEECKEGREQRKERRAKCQQRPWAVHIRDENSELEPIQSWGQLGMVVNHWRTKCLPCARTLSMLTPQDDLCSLTRLEPMRSLRGEWRGRGKLLCECCNRKFTTLCVWLHEASDTFQREKWMYYKYIDIPSLLLALLFPVLIG